MTDVLFVPGLDANLLSIKALQAKGMIIKFGLGAVEITRDNQLVATGSLVDKTYILKSSQAQVALVSTESAKTPNSKESKERDKYIPWHGRMGHPGPQRMKRLYDVSNGTDRLDIKNLDKCITCTYTKMTRVVNRTPPFRVTKKGERTYSDFWGPYKVANTQGTKYFLSFMDEYTRRSEIYLCARTDLRRCYYLYKNKFEVETKEKLRIIRTDNAKEYHSLEKELLDQGTVMEFTSYYTPEQNGVAERLNRTLIQMVSAMQLWAGLPKSFWGEAVLTANYLRNRLPVKGIANGGTPYEAWKGRKPSLEHIRTYGCLAHVHVSSETRDKMDRVSQQGIFVGYHSSKQYLVYDPKKKAVGWHTSIQFFEDWPGGPLLDTPAEPGVWELKTGGSDYEPDAGDMVMPRTDPTIDHLEDDQTRVLNMPGISTPENTLENDNDILPSVGESVGEGPLELTEIPHPPPNLPANEGISPSSPPPDSPGNIANQEIAIGPPERRVKKGKPIVITAAFSRPQRNRNPHDRYAFDNQKALLAVAYASKESQEPATFSEAMKGHDHRKWRVAIDEELQALTANGTFTIADMPPDRDLITSKWVFKIKYFASGTLDRYKARLVARGFSQKYGIDYEETFAPTLRFESLRMLLAMAAKHDLEIHQLDISNAYLQGNLDEEIYMEILEGMNVKGSKALLLKKGLYGLKQSGRIWNKRFKAFIMSKRFTPISCDNCVFIN